MDPVVSRKMWRTLEVYHGAIYFVPEARDHYAQLGITDRMMGYFGSRAAAMGAVPAEVVMATFFNFHPKLVSDRVPAVWAMAEPYRLLTARLEAADAMLRRLIGDVVESAEIAEAADLARRAAEACTPEGRPLYAGHASLDWPAQPHLQLWHAITLLREYRGDGHIAAMTVEGLDGCEALITHAAAGDVPAETLRTSRQWPQAEWDAAVERLRGRGLVGRDGSFTETGRAMRERIEHTTDVLALPPWEVLGEDDCTKLRALVRPHSKKISESGELTFR
jgi:hypothetical protein